MVAPVGPSGCQAPFMYAAVLRQAVLSTNLVRDGVLRTPPHGSSRRTIRLPGAFHVRSSIASSIFMYAAVLRQALRHRELRGPQKTDDDG